MNVGNEEIKKFYDDHKSELSRPEAVKISEILISTDQAGDDPEKLAAVKAKADDLVKQLRAGASFEDLAKKESQDPSGPQGDNFGVFKLAKWAMQLEDLTLDMQMG